MIAFFLGLTALSLLVGIVMMAIGNKSNSKWRSRIMSLRVAFQSLAIICLIVGYFAHHS